MGAIIWVKIFSLELSMLPNGNTLSGDKSQSFRQMQHLKETEQQLANNSKGVKKHSRGCGSREYSKPNMVLPCRSWSFDKSEAELLTAVYTALDSSCWGYISEPNYSGVDGVKWLCFWTRIHAPISINYLKALQSI